MRATLFALISVLFVFEATLSSSIIDPELEALFKSKSGVEAFVPVLISFDQTIETVIDRINSETFPSLLAKRTALTQAQIAFSNEAQKNLRSHLDKENVSYKSYWINNKVVIPAADFPLVRSLSSKSNINGIAKIENVPEYVYPSFDVKTANISNFIDTLSAATTKRGAPLWHIAKVRAREAWDLGYTGKGIVVASIDSGVRFTHKTLRDNWRKDYGWFDASGEFRDTPTDTSGRGTATMSLLVGGSGIGVAPGAAWIACRARSLGDLYSCAQWIQCPTRPDGSGQDCSKAPQVVSNSWGFASGDPFKEVVASWKSAGMIPVFPIGDGGPVCSRNTLSPGNSGTVFGVGACDYHNRVAIFSSRGPRDSSSNRIIPDMVAPGESVFSAGNNHDDDYQIGSGTALATPIVAGVVVMMKQKKPDVTYDRMWFPILWSTNKKMDTSRDEACGGLPPNKFANHNSGYGIVNALYSAQANY